MAFNIEPLRFPGNPTRRELIRIRAVHVKALPRCACVGSAVASGDETGIMVAYFLKPGFFAAYELQELRTGTYI